MGLFDRERPRHVREIAATSAVASIAATFAVVGISAATPAAAQTTGTDVDVVVARGTGEPLGADPGLGAVVGNPVYHALAQRLSRSHSAYRVQYPASPVEPWSVQQGNRDLVTHVTDAAKACPNQRFVLVGYSQGANVVDNSIGISSVGAKVGGPIVATLPASVTFADCAFRHTREVRELTSSVRPRRHGFRPTPRKRIDGSWTFDHQSPSVRAGGSQNRGRTTTFAPGRKRLPSRSHPRVASRSGAAMVTLDGMRLNQVTVGSTDLDRSEHFYLLLGLRPIVKTEHYLRFECPAGESTFSVDRVDAVPGGEEVTVYFETDDLDGEYRRLSDAGIAFEQSPADMPWLWREARLRDPDGHRLCLFHAAGNRRNPPWRLAD